MSNRKNTGRSFGGKGYYIALILCAAAIGISGYLYYRNASEEKPQLNNPTSAVDVVNPTGDDIQAIATQPTLNDPTLGTEPTPTQPPKKQMQTRLPVSGEITAQYAMDCLSYNETTRDWRVHNGIDIAAEAGTAVCAAADGIVYTTFEDETMGTTVIIRHEGGYTTQYASLDKTLAVSPGDTVTIGQTIGHVGNTALLETALGDHLHFSVMHNDVPMDPAKFLPTE